MVHWKSFDMSTSHVLTNEYSKKQLQTKSSRTVVALVQKVRHGYYTLSYISFHITLKPFCSANSLFKGMFESSSITNFSSLEIQMALQTFLFIYDKPKFILTEIWSKNVTQRFKYRFI